MLIYFQAVPARVTLGVTSLLTMSTKTASITNSLPPVAYTKASKSKVKNVALSKKNKLFRFRFILIFV